MLSLSNLDGKHKIVENRLDILNFVQKNTILTGVEKATDGCTYKTISSLQLSCMQNPI